MSVLSSASIQEWINFKWIVRTLWIVCHAWWWPYVWSFYQRVMFPLRNSQGQTIGFQDAGLHLKRAGKDQPKYLNSPETELFNKRQVLFNLDKARSDIRKNGEICCSKGLWMWLLHGRLVSNWISFYGDKSNSSTDPTNGKADERIGLLLWRRQRRFEATNRGIELLRQNSRLALSVVVVPEKLDPDEYLRKYGEASFQELVAHGRETVFTLNHVI